MGEGGGGANDGGGGGADVGGGGGAVDGGLFLPSIGDAEETKI